MRTSANRSFRLPRSIAHKGRAIIGKHSYVVAAVATVAALATSALVNHRLAKKAECDNPPSGEFLLIDGVRLHYVERGSGLPLVLLHGNGSMLEDFETSGLIELASKNHRVIIFDRPGFGHSGRPRNSVWSQTAQADLIGSALAQLGVTQAVVLGHSWGASVAVALALRQPNLVQALVLASGYYYPTLRPDFLGLSAPGVPIVGDILAHSIAPIVSRAIWPLLMAKIFGPQSVPPKFAGFPKQMAVRPSQIRASAAESALLIPGAFEFQNQYAALKMPVAIIAGDKDRLVDITTQSYRLHRDIAQSKFISVPGAGHMVHQTATESVMAAIRDVSQDMPSQPAETAT